MINVYFLEVIICTFIIRCCGIEEDYYYTNDKDFKKQINQQSDWSLFRRINQHIDNRNPSTSGLSTDKYVENTFFYYDKYKSKPNLKRLPTNFVQYIPKINHTKSENHTLIRTSNETSIKLNLTDILQDYEHIYSEIKEQESFKTDVNTLNPQRSKEEDTVNDTKNSYVMFYNLEPAIQRKIVKINATDYRERSWYVMHDLPCWDLPLLYGQIFFQNQQSVFTLYGWKIIDVEDPGWRDESQYKTPGQTIPSQNLNKWCEVEPCYGDHTLCVFSGKKTAEICERNYKVHVPTITDQFIIVNTINAMRNRVANGFSKRYSHLPPAANMQQVIYDYDLEKMSRSWLRQCLPGPAPCSALDNSIVSELECIKHAKFCCRKPSDVISKCVPRDECFLFAVTGCIHVWFSRAGKNLDKTDIKCGRASVKTFHTVQLLWSKTTKVGCAYGEYANGDVRVICNFAPGAPFFLDTKLFCGIISFENLRQFDKQNLEIDEEKFMSLLGLKWNRFLTTRNYEYKSREILAPEQTLSKSSMREISLLKQMYGVGWARKQIKHWENGTHSLIARLVARYQFIDKSQARCDSNESIYVIGKPGSMCVENGRTYRSLCYDFRDPTPGYRLIAVIAPIILFSLILYDLFSGVVRQTNY